MNLDDQHICHPKLGDIPTDGNRFAAILKAAQHLHGLQTGQRVADAILHRIRNQRDMRPLREAEED
jgi:hypothetical protein